MHRGLINFLNQNYGSDDAGHWFVQNGPQRVYVDLAATPWVFRREGNALLGHTGLPAGAVKAVVLDTEGNLYLHCELGIGILDDRDLAEFLIECQTADGDVADESAFAELMQGSSEAVIFWHQLPLTMITAVDLPIRFKFNPKPCA